MLHFIVFFLLGLILIILGGNYLTSGAEAIARRLKVSDLVIGVTVVAFGSAAPDLIVGITSTVQHRSQLVIGDVVGSNIFDSLLVVGIMALIRPISISKNDRELNLPFLALASLALFFCADDILIDGAAKDTIDRTDGLILLTFLIIFMVQTIRTGRLQPTVPSSPPPTPHPQLIKKTIPVWLSTVMILGGLAALFVGGNWIVDNASGIARHLGLSEGLIGLTIVGIGASLPDLATSVVAVVKKRPGIALGNVVGGCVFNSFLVIGTSATISPLDAGTINSLDFGTLAVAGMLVWLIGSIGRNHRITRLEGAFLIACYCAYFARLITGFLK